MEAIEKQMLPADQIMKLIDPSEQECALRLINSMIKNKRGTMSLNSLFDLVSKLDTKTIFENPKLIRMIEELLEQENHPSLFNFNLQLKEAIYKSAK